MPGGGGDPQAWGPVCGSPRDICLVTDKTVTQGGGSYHQGQIHTLPYGQRNIHENVFINIIKAF